MALTPSNTFEKGASAPDFNLPDTVSGETVSLQDVRGEQGTVIMFICNHCPFVLHVNDELIRLAKEYQNRGFGFVAISSNDVENYPQDGPELMKQHGIKLGYPFPYLYDESQEVAKAYDAACTPDLYIFDKHKIRKVFSLSIAFISDDFHYANCSSIIFFDHQIGHSIHHADDFNCLF